MIETQLGEEAWTPAGIIGRLGYESLCDVSWKGVIRWG